MSIGLPAGVTVFERGWLSSNNILHVGNGPCAVVDTGYGSHAVHTELLVAHALGGRALDAVVNTHLHSDHCGGNAALQAKFAGVRTWIPPGQAAAVRDWDADMLTYAPTGQFCPPFRVDDILRAGTTVQLGSAHWEIHAAPGHDPHAVLLFEPETRTLISADALWENGFGVVFPELEGEAGFDDVARTLDLIESLMPRVVIPGHGRVFNTVDAAISIARGRLDRLSQNPGKHAQHAAKVLLKFKLLELQATSEVQLLAWARRTPYFVDIHARFFPAENFDAWNQELVDGLIASQAARRDGPMLVNI